jgi:hypothetical protein
MTPGNDVKDTTRRGRGQGKPWYRTLRCAVCGRFIWFQRIALEEPVEAPEPCQEWVLCKPCHEALLMEMLRSTLNSPVRLRIALGLVAAERSPHYNMSALKREQWEFQRELNLVIWLMILFFLLHLVIFFLLLGVPK